MDFLSNVVNSVPHISVISKIEVLRFNDTLEKEALLEDFINISIIHSLSNNVVGQTIELCKKSNPKIKLPDAVIAATSLVKNFILVTRNVDDFKNIPDLVLLNPWDIPIA